ncbi:hypothetical protein Vadar_026965 [Vaccinium darrowii]|uniref:Uncharacterized protein n=1 Tax=Vaccinium darrowii TaxID=229202 RepID=A0ACB7Y2G6_9ERIC|nr:hypothetical protein Vadar_026965 [Vaccinium darrowii]
MKRSVSGKILSEKEKKKSAEKQGAKNNRFLITVNVLGSAGPMRFVVNEEENVKGVIGTALKLYAREKRLPVLGSDVSDFFLYPANAGSEALSLTESIGSSGARNFVLSKIQKQPQMTEARSLIKRKGNGSKLKAWLNKSFSFNVLLSPQKCGGVRGSTDF